MELTRTSIWKRTALPRLSWSWLVISILGILLACLLAYPVVLIFIKSLTVSRPGQPTVWGLEGWIEAFHDPNLPLAVGNTFLLAFARIIITTVLAVFFAWVVTRTDTPFK
ncbi:MAG TPA: hypothetical protein VGB25_02635, partial [Candidatus Binatia bacterium]